MGAKTDFLKFVCKSKALNYVEGRGDPRSPIWIIGEAPGADEDQAGIVFVGGSGKQLDSQIFEAGLSPNDIYFTNPFTVRPPGNDIACRHALGIPDNVYLEAFFEKLEEFKPTFIVAAGATPLSILIPYTKSKDGNPRISAWRGSLLQCNRLNWPHYVVPMYHPAFILREYSERVIAVFCLARIKEEFAYWQVNGRLLPLPSRQLIDDPTGDDILTYLWDCLQSPRKISVDIENPFYKRMQIPYVINFSHSPNSAISFSLWDLPSRFLVPIWKRMAEILSTKEIIGQNYINFDIRYLEESVGLRTNLNGLDDTMTRHKVLWPEFEHALQFQTIQYTREPYYKDEGHDWDTRGGKKALRTYGAKDAAITYEIWEGQETELDARGLRQFYEEIEMPLARNFHLISNRGIRVDETQLAILRIKVTKYLDGICEKAKHYIGRPVFYDGDSAKDYQRSAKAFVVDAAKAKGGKIKIKQGDIPVFNLGSPKQILEEFDRLKIYLPSENGSRKTDEEAMQKSLAKTGHELPKLILESRGLNKLKGTNIDANLKNGILYTNYYTTGTVNGRRSSSSLWENTPFAYGSNTQNLPKHGKGIIGDFQKEFKECLIARPGKIFLSCDQIQAEDWIVQGIIADQSGILKGFKELLDGVDRHRKLASHIFNKSEADCGKDTHERFLGKKTRHAGNYDMGAFRFACTLAKEGFHIPEDHCQLLLNAFHSFDPGIRGVFHRYVRERLEICRELVNPFGRSRIFFGLHPYRDNTKIFKEAYSTLPQSTVSDNTAQAVNFVEDATRNNDRIKIIKEDHDAITLEVLDNVADISDGIRLLASSFDRNITMEKGLTFKIPIEWELGYNLGSHSKKKDQPEIWDGMKGVTQLNFEEVREKLIAVRRGKEETVNV